MQQGDFTQLAKHYHNRVGYSLTVLKTLLHEAQKINANPSVVDVGAGTGKLTENLLQLGLKVVAVEPNDAMREEGKKYTAKSGAEWCKGSGEHTGLPDNSFDFERVPPHPEAGRNVYHHLEPPRLGTFTASEKDRR